MNQAKIALYFIQESDGFNRFCFVVESARSGKLG